MSGDARSGSTPLDPLLTLRMVWSRTFDLHGLAPGIIRIATYAGPAAFASWRLLAWLKPDPYQSPLFCALVVAPASASLTALLLHPWSSSPELTVQLARVGRPSPPLCRLDERSLRLATIRHPLYSERYIGGI